MEPSGSIIAGPVILSEGKVVRPSELIGRPRGMGGTMPLDVEFLADQIRRAFRGESWHGPSVLEVLAGVSAEDAAAHPIAGAHSIWEIVLHIRAWERVALRRIDEWLDLKRYVRSGDDYTNLVDGLRNALKNLDRVYPDYAGQGVELAGLVWFQGLADSTSTSMTAAYQTNLVNLIKDLALARDGAARQTAGQ